MTSGDPTVRRISLTAKILTLVVMTLLTLGTAEIAARLLYDGCPALLIRDPWHGSLNLEWAHFFRQHPALFWELRPDLDEPLSFVGDRTDSMGFRNRTTPSAKGEAPRVLCMGCSCTYGMGLSIDETWPSRLAAISGHDVINAGVPGYSTYQGRLLYEDRCTGLDPDVVVLEYGPSDMVTWDSHQDGLHFGISDRDRARHAEFSRWRCRLRVVEWLRSLTLPAPEDLAEIDPRAACPRVTIGDYEANLREMASKAPRAVILLWPIPCQVDPRVRQYFPVERYEAYQEAARRVAREHVLVDPLPTLRRSGLPVSSLYLDSVHMTGAATRLVARDVLQAIREEPARAPDAPGGR